MEKNVKTQSHYFPTNGRKKTHEIIAEMSEESRQKNNRETTKFVAQTALKTLLFLVAGFYLFVCVSFVLFPNVSAKIFEGVGANNASLIASERVLAKDYSATNLYNVIQKSVKVGDYERIEHYYDRIVSRDDYAEFQTKLNILSRSSVTLDKVVYVYDVDSYLASLYVEAQYNLSNNDSARQWFYLEESEYTQPGITNHYRCTVPTYIYLLENDDKMTLEEKQEELQAYLAMEFNHEKTVYQLIKDKVAAIGNLFEEETTVAGKLFNLYTQRKICVSLVRINTIISNSTEKSFYESKVSELTESYNSLLAANL